MYRQSVKKLVKQYLLHMSPQYGELRPTSGWDRFVSLGTPGNFNGFRVLTALLHGTLEVVVSQIAAFNRGRHIYSAGRPSRWHWPTFLVYYIWRPRSVDQTCFSCNCNCLVAVTWPMFIGEECSLSCRKLSLITVHRRPHSSTTVEWCFTVDHDLCVIVCILAWI